MAFPQPFRGKFTTTLPSASAHAPHSSRRVVGDVKATVVAKPESFNPLWSVKDRIGVSMIDAAEREGKVNKNTTIVEPTSGIPALAWRSPGGARLQADRHHARDHELERRRLLKAFGAEVVLTPGDKGMNGAIAKAEEILKNTPTRSCRSNSRTRPTGNSSQDHGRGDLGRQRRQGGYPDFRRRHRRHH